MVETYLEKEKEFVIYTIIINMEDGKISFVWAFYITRYEYNTS